MTFSLLDELVLRWILSWHSIGSEGEKFTVSDKIESVGLSMSIKSWECLWLLAIWILIPCLVKLFPHILQETKAIVLPSLDGNEGPPESDIMSKTMSKKRSQSSRRKSNINCSSLKISTSIMMFK